MTGLKWDVFISHASEDKAEVARPLAHLLAGHRLRPWIDECELKPGDSLRAKIDEGLRESRFGLVVISPHFLIKPWTNAELGGLFAREIRESEVLVPVWHRVDASQVAARSPLLADRVAMQTAGGLQAIAARVAEMLRREVPSYRPGVPMYGGRLTKKMLLELPERAFLLGNMYNHDGTPKIAQLVPSLDQRESFWIQLKALRMSTSKFYVFSSAEEYRAHMSTRIIHGL
jgi:hypothetical protein